MCCALLLRLVCSAAAIDSLQALVRFSLGFRLEHDVVYVVAGDRLPDVFVKSFLPNAWHVVGFILLNGLVGTLNGVEQF